jgi:hypothetical protein
VHGRRMRPHAPHSHTTPFWLLPLPHPPGGSEVLEHANELRVMLCKDKVTQLPDGTTKRGTQVIAACGIYVSDILDAVPIDKVGWQGEWSPAHAQERQRKWSPVKRACNSCSARAVPSLHVPAAPRVGSGASAARRPGRLVVSGFLLHQLLL